MPGVFLVSAGIALTLVAAGVRATASVIHDGTGAGHAPNEPDGGYFSLAVSNATIPRQARSAESLLYAGLPGTAKP